MVGSDTFHSDRLPSADALMVSVNASLLHVSIGSERPQDRGFLRQGHAEVRAHMLL